MRTDLIYGWKAINQNNGFTAAQASMNVLETLLYLHYLYLVYSHGTRAKTARAAGSPKVLNRRSVHGQPGALAAATGFTAAIMTLSKTVLYGM